MTLDALRTPRVRADEFDQIARLPENADKVLELIQGEIVEMPSNPYVSFIGMRIAVPLGVFVFEHGLGFVTGEAGGYMIGEERYAPDVAFVSKARQAELAREGYNPVAPDLVVEVLYPSTSREERALRRKIANYVAAGVVVWAVLVEEQIVEVYVPGQFVRILGVGDVLDGGAVLPGFALPLRLVFGEQTPPAG
jgi:Uma2 family endonuclease